MCSSSLCLLSDQRRGDGDQRHGDGDNVLWEDAGTEIMSCRSPFYRTGYVLTFEMK